MGIVQDPLRYPQVHTAGLLPGLEPSTKHHAWVPLWDGTVPTPAIIEPKSLWTGKQILSMTIPRGNNIIACPRSAIFGPSIR